MATSILNFVFESFLSKFVEIDTSKTNFSLLSGDIELSNLKIKDEIFTMFDLPFIEVVSGYVGSIVIHLQMPFFYDHAIKVFVDKIFFHARLKNINKLNKEDEIKNMQNLKESNLLSAEQVFAQVEEEGKKSPGLVQKIINNIAVEICDIVFKLDDEISYPEIPYSLAVILDNIKVRSTRADYKIPKNPDEVIPYEEINYKVVAIDNFTVYMDCFDDKEELNYEKLISPKVTQKIDVNLRNYLRDKFAFYSYCMSEIYVHSRKFESHQYLLHQLDLSVHVAMNDNVMNKKPKISAIIAFPQILLGISMKQIRTLLKVKAYLDLNTLFQSGIAKEFYNKELTQNEKNSYIDAYLGYFQKKYIEKQSVEFPTSLTNMEERLDYKSISEMRTTTLKKLSYTTKINEITKKIESEEGKLFGKDEGLIFNLREERNRIIKLEEQFMKTGKSEEIEDTTADEQDELKDLEDSYAKIYAKIDILVISFTIYETVIRKENNTWELRDKLLTIGIKDLGVEAKIQKVGLMAFIHLDNIIVAQEKVRNPNYNKIFFGDLTVKGYLLCIIFEMNPKLKKSDMRVKVWSERQVYIIADIYTLLYIKEQITDVLATGIDLEEAGSYAKDGIYNYIKDGYQNRLVEGTTDDTAKFTHTNLYLDVNLKSPFIIVPVDIFDFNNFQCLILCLGELKVQTILPPRVDEKINYTRSKDVNILYDVYRVGVLGIRMATVENCIEKNNYLGKETLLLKNFDVSVEAKLLIQPKNPNFNNMVINILIPEIFFQLNEFQILLLIQFLGNMNSAQTKLTYEMKLKKIEERFNKRKLARQELQKTLQNLGEEAKKQKEKNEKEEIEKKRKELKEKREKENIARAKIVYDKVIKSFSMSDHSIAKYETMKAKKGKKAILVNVVIVKTKFAIRKLFADLSIEDYLVFQIDTIKVEVDIMLTGIMLIGLIIKHISLTDVDKDERKQLYLCPEYITLIESAKEGQMGNYGSEQDSKYCFIDLNMLMLGEEMDMFINMNDLHIIITLNTIERLNQFGMYYLDVFTQENFHTDTERFLAEKQFKKKLAELGGKEVQREKHEELVKEELNREYMERLKKYVKSIYSIDQVKDYIEKKHKVKTLENYIEYFSDVESSKRGKKVFVIPERSRSKMRIIFNMNNTMFKLPLDHYNLKEPLLSMNFDMTFTMDAKNVFDNILAMPSRKLLAQIYETKSSFMHISLSQFDFDMVYLNPRTKTFSKNLPSERFLSNFRLKCSIDSDIQPYIEESVMNINVILEPLILAFGMRQVRKLMGFLDKVSAFTPKLQEKYFPHVKPEQVVNGVVKKPPKKKYKAKNIFRKILVRNQLNKILKQTLKKKQTKKEEIFINTNKFNSQMGIKCQIDKISVILFDNTTSSKTIMLNINMTKLLVNMKMNSRLRYKENMLLALYEILTADILPRTNFNLNQLAMYIDVMFAIDANYLNIMINDFEPLLERFNMGVNIIQVAPFCKMKGYVTTNDVINFNLSTDSVIALNKFLLTFMQDEKMWEHFMQDEKMWEQINNNRRASIFAPMMNASNEPNEEIILKFLNVTGVDIVFYFDDNPNYKIPIKNGAKVDFTRNSLYKARGHDRHRNPYQKTTFSLSIGDCKPIEHINFQRNNYRQFKANLQNNYGRKYPVNFGIKVESSGIINTVIFCPSLSFFNDTKYENISLLINNQNIADNTIIIPKGKKGYVPLTWFMCESPESTVSIKLSQNGQYSQICNNISEFIIPPVIDDHILKQREKDKNRVKKEFPEVNNPTFIKMIEIKKSELDNRKDSKTVMINDNGINKSISLDYFILESKDIKKLKDKAKNNREQITVTNNNTIIVDTNTTMAEFIPVNDQIVQYSYEYVVYVRPYITIINKIPFPINIQSQSGNITLDTLEKECIYNADMTNMSFTMEYNNALYTSESFSLDQENIYVVLNSNNSPRPLKCHIFRNPVALTMPTPQKFFCEIRDYSISSYEYVLFFDYLFTNRLTKKIWIRPCEEKGVAKLTPEQLSENIVELPPSSLSLLSLPEYETDCVIRDANSPWSAPFNINTIGVQGVVKLDSTNYPVNQGNTGNSQYNNFQATNEIACLLSGSDVYDFSVIIVFEPKYVIINNLGFDIVYRQEGYNNMYPLRAKDYQTLIYEKGDKNFRIGIRNDSAMAYNFSGIFNLENIMDVDLKVKVDKNSSKYNQEMKLFSYDGKEYYILIRIINQTYDQGTVYLLLTHPHFPYFEISNMTQVPLRVYEEGHEGFIICNYRQPIVPFVWENSNNHKDKIYFEIYGRRASFNYSIFKEETLNIPERGTHLLYSVSSKNKTITRRFEIKTRENLTGLERDALSMYFKDKKRPNSMYFDIFIRGFGISIIDTTPQEVFYISLYNLKIKYISNVLLLNGGAQTNSTMNVVLYIDNMQIDYCLNDSLRVVLSPKDQLVPSVEKDIRELAKKEGREVVPFISVLLTMSTKINNFKEEKISAYDQIDFTMQEFDIKVEQYALMNVLKIVMEMVSAFDFSNKILVKEDKEPLLDIEMHIPLKKLLNENENSVMQLIYYLFVGALKLNLTLRLDLSSIPLGLPKTAQRIIGTIGNTLGRITDCPLRFNEKVVENVYMSWGDVSMIIVKRYITEGITQIYKVLGSLDIIGNPVKLVRNIGGGFYDFVNEPRKGFRLGPKEFGLGVAKGVGSLIYGIVGGIFDFIQRIAGTLYAATQSLTGHDRESMSIEDENEPSNIISGFYEGFVGFGKEIGKGIYSCCREPCQKTGTVGTCKGVCSGILKLVISPFAGILKLVTCIFAGFKNTCYYLTGKKRIVTKRFRHPRVIVEGDKKLMPYEENKAEARELLYQLEKIDNNNILFADDFICPDCPRRMCTAILTDDHMYVVYNNNKILFKLNTEHATNAKLHYIDDRFYLAFDMNTGNKKGFPISYEYSTVATGLYDILYHKYNIGQIMYAEDGKQGPQIIYNDLTMDDLFDKSSYTNTIIGQPSIYSNKTLISKLTGLKSNGTQLKNLNINNKNNINNYKHKVLESESVQNLNPKSKNGDYISLDVK